MSPEYWQKVKVILSDAAAVSPSGRADFFRVACGGDVDLQREVESLLAFESDDEDILDDPPCSVGSIGDSAGRSSAFIGTRIGKYLVIDVIAAGGMGTVFLAERADGEFDQKVALKVIKRGMDSDAVLRRFFNERRILASLEHPHIARLIDGGTTDDNVPYFVMEFVDGTPITDHVANNNLGIDEILRLFIKVASAVSYAHQNLVIHRDIKPSNILVTAAGEPKLLDFGIAKLLMTGNGGIVTATQQFVLTPDYASPEQVRGEQLSTASDIYSLGVILYELLTSKRPYRTGESSFGEIVQIVCETMPPAPSRTAAAETSRLRGDIDNIVLKALRKEPERRYSSVEQFSEDVRRHLERLPIIAGSDTWGYRAGKFLSRHRYLAITISLIVISLLAGLGATMYQARVARIERAKADQRFKDVRDLANSFIFEVNEKIDESPIRARELLITRAIEYLDRLSKETDGDADLQSELATAYEKIGDVQARLFSPSLGKTSDALASHEKALAIRDSLYALDNDDPVRGTNAVRSRLFVGDINSMMGRISDAYDQYEKAAAIGEGMAERRPDSPEIRLNLGRAYARLGQNVLRTGSLGRALAYYERSRDISLRLLAESPNDPARQHALSVIYNYIAYVKMEMLEFPEANKYLKDALTIDENIAALDPGNAVYRGYVADSNLWLGIGLREAGEMDASFRHLFIALEAVKASYDSDPANVGNRNSLADCYIEIGKAHLRTREYKAAAVALEIAGANYQLVANGDPNNLNAQMQVLITERLLADALANLGRRPESSSKYLAMIDEVRRLIENDPMNLNWQNELVQAELDFAGSLASTDRLASAGHYQVALEILETLSALSPENARLRSDVELAKRQLSRMQKPTDRPAKAP